MSGTTDEQAAKAFVNTLRKAVGLRALGKLKKGIPNHPRMCPITLSLEDCGVRYADYDDDGNPHMVSLGGSVGVGMLLYDEPQVAQFMADFDEGKYPNLEIPKATTMKIKKPGERKLTEVLL